MYLILIKKLKSSHSQPDWYHSFPDDLPIYQTISQQQLKSQEHPHQLFKVYLVTRTTAPGIVGCYVLAATVPCWRMVVPPMPRDGCKRVSQKRETFLIPSFYTPLLERSFHIISQWPLLLLMEDRLHITQGTHHSSSSVSKLFLCLRLSEEAPCLLFYSLQKSDEKHP